MVLHPVTAVETGGFGLRYNGPEVLVIVIASGAVAKIGAEGAGSESGLKLERGGYDGLGPLGGWGEFFGGEDFSVPQVQEQNRCGRTRGDVRLGGVVPHHQLGEVWQQANQIAAAYTGWPVK